MSCHEYIKALEQEKCKIQPFQLELPLCLELINQAIETCKQQKCMHGGQSQPECSKGPTLRDVPSLRMCSSNFGRNYDDHHPHRDDNNNKVNWLRSAEIWIPSSSNAPEGVSKKTCFTEANINEGAFQHLNKGKDILKTSVSQLQIEVHPCETPTAISITPMLWTRGNDNNKNDDKVMTQRKQRRCWTPELHRKFVDALHQLGGLSVARPRQIKELMNVDGLTVDQIKSHLQKYRLYTRGSPSSSQNPRIHKDAISQAPQSVLGDGIQMTPAYIAASTGEPYTAITTIATGTQATHTTMATSSASGEASTITLSKEMSTSVATPTSEYGATIATPSTLSSKEK